MATDEEIHVGDIGTVFVVTIKEGTTAVDISNALQRILYIQRKDRTMITINPASFASGDYGAGDGTDGKLMYTSVLGDLTIKGTYKIQAKVEMPNGQWYSSIASFDVYVNLV